GSGAVTGDVVGLLGDLLDELGADLLVRLLELDLLGDGDTVVGDGGGAPLLLQHDVAALGAERHLDGVSERVHAALAAATGFLGERDQFGCHRVPGLPGRADTRRSDPMPATDDRGPDGVPVPAAAASSSRSWISTPATGVLTTPLFSTRPLRVQTPRRGFPCRLPAGQQGRGRSRAGAANTTAAPGSHRMRRSEGWGARSAAAGHGGDDRHLGTVGGGRVQPVGEPDVLVADVDVD